MEPVKQGKSWKVRVEDEQTNVRYDAVSKKMFATPDGESEREIQHTSDLGTDAKILAATGHLQK